MTAYAAPSSNPGQSALAQYSDSQLLLMILTELRILNLLFAEATDSNQDLAALRIAVMNDNDIITADAG